MKHHTSLFAGVFAAAVCLLSASGAQAAYGDLAADLVYTPVAPCRIADTRIAGGTLTANTARGFDVTAVSDYSFQGGEANNCAIGNAGSFAAVAVNITVINPNVSGSLKAFAFGATTPASAIAMSYAAGEVRSNFAVLKIDQGASANELSVVSTASAHLTIDVVGYFGALPTPPAQATPTLSCTNVNSAAATVSPGGGSVCAVAACAAGYVVTGGGISSGAYSNNNTVSEATIYSSAATGNSWQVCHIGTSAMTGTLTFTSQARCCRIQ